MPPDEKFEAIRSRMIPEAISIVKQSPAITAPGASDPETDELAFENELYRYASDWLEQHEDSKDQAKPYAIVLSRSITDDQITLAQAGITGRRYEAFKHQRGNEITGCLILATMNFEQAIVVKIDSALDAQSLFEAVSSCGCGNRIYGVLEPHPKNLIVRRPNGSVRSMVVPSSNQHSPWTNERLEDELGRLHAAFTRAPNGVVMPWLNAKEGLTVDRLELRISKALAYALDVNFLRGSILSEAESSSGRIDIYLAPGVLTSGAAGIIEVKVLRRYKSANFNTWWANKGVKQADIYRNDYSASVAYLCCFDARDDDEDQPEVEAFAASRNVRSRRYFMYRSSDALQAAS